MTGDNRRAYLVALAEQAAEQLTGTCQSIHDLGEEHEEAFNETPYTDRLDELTFECTTCGWWCEMDECRDDPSSGEWVCAECLGEDEDDG